MKRRAIYALVILLAACVCAIPFRGHIRRHFEAAAQVMKGKKTVSDRVDEFGSAVRARLTPHFREAGVPYPPKEVVLVGLKQERRLEVWALAQDTTWRPVKPYPILGMSGVLGPKLREGDMQVPEGIYEVESLNPNSRFHLALRMDYPNEEDRRRGREDGRNDLGSDIMIHGSNCSIGCLAMGDEAAEDLFVLAAETGIENVRIILSPVDFRVTDLPDSMPDAPEWTAELYESIRHELARVSNYPPAARR